ncbi:glycosyltransferase family 4 protein [Methylocystis iwaonis]|uniref:glycosyltransferase family 4 protein n=1 Tax=Methylocystis iwaonis TaxID=2885079 RepID=UPI00249394A4|nr:glycosyltransferase family 1 protein [Methylocystis iwaonis]
MPLTDAATPVVYDVTRLVTRGLNPSPNGIDRVDFALARHFLAKGATPLVCTALGPRLSDTQKALATLEAIEAYWREAADADEDGVYHSVVAALAGEGAGPDAIRLDRKPGFERVSRNWRALRDWAFHLGRSISEAPNGAVYFNATQFLLDRQWYVRWLEARPDVKPVAFIHDLLPVDHPEFFRPIEATLHPRRNRNIARMAAGVVSASRAVAERFAAFATENGRADIPDCVAPLPVSPVFETPSASPEALRGRDYFIVCGTIEPRKNHLLLLNVWRELAKGGPAPKLIVVGKRGWLNENVVDMMTRCPSLRASVIEAGGLSTPGLRRLMAGARALLMPSFGEGFGLPVAEALAAGVPVIASDLDVFRELGGDAPDFLDPLDGLGWLQAVRDYRGPDSPRRAATLARMKASTIKSDPSDFFETIDRFVATIAARAN